MVANQDHCVPMPIENECQTALGTKIDYRKSIIE